MRTIPELSVVSNSYVLADGKRKQVYVRKGFSKKVVNQQTRLFEVRKGFL
jgi:hypothetical protein